MNLKGKNKLNLFLRILINEKNKQGLLIISDEANLKLRKCL